MNYIIDYCVKLHTYLSRMIISRLYVDDVITDQWKTPVTQIRQCNCLAAPFNDEWNTSSSSLQAQ